MSSAQKLACQGHSLTKLDCDDVLATLLVPDLKFYVVGKMAALSNLEDNVLIWIATRNPPVLNSNIAKGEQRCTSICTLSHACEGVLAEDEISAVARSRVSDHDCHTLWRAVVRICAPHLITCTTANPVPVEACRCRNITIVECCSKCAILTCSIFSPFCIRIGVI